MKGGRSILIWEKLSKEIHLQDKAAVSGWIQHMHAIVHMPGKDIAFSLYVFTVAALISFRAHTKLLWFEAYWHICNFRVGKILCLHFYSNSYLNIHRWQDWKSVHTHWMKISEFIKYWKIKSNMQNCKTLRNIFSLWLRNVDLIMLFTKTILFSFITNCNTARQQYCGPSEHIYKIQCVVYYGILLWYNSIELNWIELAA